MKKKHIIWTIGAVALSILVAYSIISTVKREKALQDSVVVIGEVEGLEPSRNGETVYVRYIYDGKVFFNTFGTYHYDSLKVKIKIILKVSKKYPAKYIKYIDIYHAPNAGPTH